MHTHIHHLKRSQKYAVVTVRLYYIVVLLLYQTFCRLCCKTFVLAIVTCRYFIARSCHLLYSLVSYQAFFIRSSMCH